MNFNTQLTLNLNASMSCSASLFCRDRTHNITASPEIYTQLLHYTCGTNESVCILTWKQMIAQKRFCTIKVHEPSLPILYKMFNKPG